MSLSVTIAAVVACVVIIIVVLIAGSLLDEFFTRVFKKPDSKWGAFWRVLLQSLILILVAMLVGWLLSWGYDKLVDWRLKSVGSLHAAAVATFAVTVMLISQYNMHDNIQTFLGRKEREAEQQMA